MESPTISFTGIFFLCCYKDSLAEKLSFISGETFALTNDSLAGTMVFFF